MFGRNAIPSTTAFREEIIGQMEHGSETMGWYFALPWKAAGQKVIRLLRKSDPKKPA
jgi:hypothetical protein